MVADLTEVVLKWTPARLWQETTSQLAFIYILVQHFLEYASISMQSVAISAGITTQLHRKRAADSTYEIQCVMGTECA